MRRLQNRLTYANVTATLALIVALGGTSYAAFTLPRDSVGAAQLRKGAVRSSEVKNSTLQAIDLSGKARRVLRGARGPAGPAGAQGPAGAAAPSYFEALRSSGQPAAGNATSEGHGTGIGTYFVGFSHSAAGCVYTATLGTTDTSTAPAGRIAVNTNADGTIGVQTYDPAGTPTDLPFH